MNKLFNQEYQQEFIVNSIQSYKEFLEDLREGGEEDLDSENLSRDFVKEFSKLIHSKDLNEYSPLKFYWLTLIDNFVYMIQLHDEAIEEGIDPMARSQGISEMEIEIREFWEESDWAQAFLESLKDGKSVLAASEDLLTIMENQILSFFHLHISRKDFDLEEPFLYQIIQEIGDYEKRINFSDEHFYLNLEEITDTWPMMPLKAKSLEYKAITFEMMSDDQEYEYEREIPVVFDDKKFWVIPTSTDTQERINEIKNKVIRSLELIKSSNVDLLKTVLNYTTTVVCLETGELKSYSLQSLPGYSVINTSQEVLDVARVLVKETAHHYINTILNFAEITDEESDQDIYKNVWNGHVKSAKSLAYFVFTQSFIFEFETGLPKKDLNTLKNIVLGSARLLHSKKMLQEAIDNNVLIEEGIELLSEVFELVESKKQHVIDILAQLETEFPADFDDIINEVKKL